jgi:hypothetical protein
MNFGRHRGLLAGASGGGVATRQAEDRALVACVTIPLAYASQARLRGLAYPLVHQKSNQLRAVVDGHFGLPLRLFIGAAPFSYIDRYRYSGQMIDPTAASFPLTGGNITVNIETCQYRS